MHTDLSKSDGAGVLQEPDIHQHIGEVDHDEEPEAAQPKPGPAQPHREEQGGQGEDVHDGGGGGQEGGEVLCCHQPEEEVQEEDDPESKVNL